jgi:diamine N-acetyltransferase
MIHIRRANKSEVKDLQDLNDEVFIDNQKYDSDLDMNWAQSEKGKEYFTDLLNNPNACCFIAEENGKKIGYIAAGPKTVSYRKSKYIEIENMGVIPEYRSNGIGTLLMKECLKWAKSVGFQKAFVNAYFENTMAVEFYRRNGFSEIDVSLERNL